MIRCGRWRAFFKPGEISAPYLLSTACVYRSYWKKTVFTVHIPFSNRKYLKRSNQFCLYLRQLLKLKGKQICNVVSNPFTHNCVAVRIFQYINVCNRFALLHCRQVDPTVIIFSRDFMFPFLIHRLKSFRMYCSGNICIFIMKAPRGKPSSVCSASEPLVLRPLRHLPHIPASLACERGIPIFFLSSLYIISVKLICPSISVPLYIFLYSFP